MELKELDMSTTKILQIFYADIRDLFSITSNHLKSVLFVVYYWL